MITVGIRDVILPGDMKDLMNKVTEAKKAGKVRYVGFTGHKDPSVHLRMLELAENHRFEFDTVQMPLNVMDAHFRSFGKEVLPVLVRKKIGVLGMKSMASGHILESKTVSPFMLTLCLKLAEIRCNYRH